MTKQNFKKVCVLVVTYNGMKWVDRCFGSLEESAYPAEITVIDNGSTDGTASKIEEDYPGVDLIRTDRNLGFGGANNIGIKNALENGSDYVFLLNQDAWIEPDTIEKLVKIADENREYGIISPMHLNGSGTALDFLFSTYIDARQCPDLISDIFLSQTNDVYSLFTVNAAAWFVGRSVFEEVGYFDDLFFMYGEDDNFADRTKYHGYKIGVTPKTRIFHDRTDKELKKRDPGVDYAIQLKRMKRIVLNPNSTYPKKQFRLFRKSMTDFLGNVESGNFTASLKNLKILCLGVYYNIRYHNRYK